MRILRHTCIHTRLPATFLARDEAASKNSNQQVSACMRECMRHVRGGITRILSIIKLDSDSDLLSFEQGKMPGPTFLHSFIPSFIHSFIPSFLHSFIPVLHAISMFFQIHMNGHSCSREPKFFFASVGVFCYTCTNVHTHTV
jgi:hypothetical protein